MTPVQLQLLNIFQLSKLPKDFLLSVRDVRIRCKAVSNEAIWNVLLLASCTNHKVLLKGRVILKSI